MPAKAARTTAKKNPIWEGSVSLSAFPSTTASLDLISTSASTSVDSAEARGDGEEVPLGDDDADGVGVDGVGVDGVGVDGVGVDRVDACGVGVDGVGLEGVKVRLRLSVKT
jgi:hypothetical protein